MPLPRIALTIGDPAGIGPEICRKAAVLPEVKKKCRLVIVGDTSHPFRMGKASVTAGRLSGEWIRDAVGMAMRGEVDALVTAPINKVSFAMGGWGDKYTGHTEMLAALTKTRHVALMLATGSLRAVHVTSHIPIRKVAPSLSVARVFETIRLAHDGLRAIGFRRPRIGVSALNPHAGDDGLLGDEEKKIISPAIKKARSRGIDASGPYSSDILWPLVENKTFDVGVAMYHDQGQIAVKLRGSSSAQGKWSPGGVNVTLGLPIIRTSPAHGSAYDIAGKGIASEKSLVEAILMAVDLAKVKRRGR